MTVTTVKIEGMMCENCEKHIVNAFKENFDIKSVRASKDNNEAIIKSKERLDEEKAKKIVEDAGYTFISISEAEEKFPFFGKKG